MTHKRKKNSRTRGSKTHGGGAMKKRRGAGNRGGRGNAGSGKRGDAKKPKFWKNKKYFGKFGFSSINKKEVNTINLTHLSDVLDSLTKKEKAVKSKDMYKVDLKDIKVHKLLGSGSLNKKVEITAQQASKKAIEKVEKAGGKVILPNQD